MKSLMRLMLVFALVFSLAPWAEAAVEPFVRVDWGASPVQVMDRMGVPAFNKIDFDAKKTEFIAYRQTVSAYNFIFYYFFADDELYQVRLELKEELRDTGVADLGGTINSMLEHALTTNAHDGFSETTVQARSQEGQPYASAMWWYTTETFALSVINAATDEGGVIFDVLLVDAANPANAELIGDYREITAQIKAQNEAQALAQAQAQEGGTERFASQPEETAKPGLMAILTDKLRALASGALNNWLRNAIIVLAITVLLVFTVMLWHGKRSDRSERRTLAGKTASKPADKVSVKATAKAAAGFGVKGPEQRSGAVAATKTGPVAVSAAKASTINAPVGGRQLRMVSASRSGSGKGSKLSFRK